MSLCSSVGNIIRVYGLQNPAYVFMSEFFDRRTKGHKSWLIHPQNYVFMFFCRKYYKSLRFTEPHLCLYVWVFWQKNKRTQKLINASSKLCLYVLLSEKNIRLSESAIYRVLAMSGVNFNLKILVFTDKYVNLRMIASCLVAGDGKR